MPTSPKRDHRSRSGSDSRPSEALAALAALTLIAILVGGGMLLFSHRSKGPQIDLMVGADVTGSVHKGDRQHMFGILDATVSSVLPKGTPIAMWSFDVNAHKFSDITPSKPEDLWSDEDQIMAQHTSAFGTYPGVALKEMIPAVQEAEDKGRGIAIMLLTDGEDQNPKDTVAQLTQLAGMNGLKAVWICGATAQNGFRSVVERRMKPILGERLVVTSSNDSEDGLNRFRSLIER